MNFRDAYKELEDGKKIRRREWEKSSYIQLNGFEVKAYRQDLVPFIYDLNILISKEWTIVGQDGEHNFVDAIDALTKGEKIKLKNWADNCYLIMLDNDIYYHSIQVSQASTLSYRCLVSHDWELA